MGMSVGGGDDEDEGGSLVEINVTPMVDVLLSLLIIFMISQPSPPNEKIPLDVPQQPVTQQPSDPNASLLVTVDENGRARIGDRPLAEDFDALVSELQKNEKAQADNKLVISAADKSKYQAVIRVMSAAHRAGIEQVSIASDRL